MDEAESLHAGRGSMNRTYFSSYAQYFVKFLQSYAAAGLTVQATTIQNEVDTDQNGSMPACIWSQQDEVVFVKKLWLAKIAIRRRIR